MPDKKKCKDCPHKPADPAPVSVDAEGIYYDCIWIGDLVADGMTECPGRTRERELEAEIATSNKCQIAANKRTMKAQGRISKLEIENNKLKEALEVFRTFCKCKHPAIIQTTKNKFGEPISPYDLNNCRKDK